MTHGELIDIVSVGRCSRCGGDKLKRHQTSLHECFTGALSLRIYWRCEACAGDVDHEHLCETLVIHQEPEDGRVTIGWVSEDDEGDGRMLV
jgi:hypothetical protein